MRQGIEGLLARDSPESLFFVLLYSLLSTVQIYEDRKSSPHDWKIVNWNVKRKHRQIKYTLHLLSVHHFCISKLGTLYSISFGQVKIILQPIINTHLHLSRTCFNTVLLYLSFYVYLFVCGEPGQLYYMYLACCFLSHQIGIFAVGTHVRKYYPTYPIPTGWEDKQWTVACLKTGDVIVMLKLTS